MFKEILKRLVFCLFSILFINFFGISFDFVYNSSDGEEEARLFKAIVDSIILGKDIGSSSSGSSSPDSMSRSSSEVSLSSLADMPEFKHLFPQSLPFDGIHPALACLGLFVTAGILCYLLYKVDQSDKAYRAAKAKAKAEREAENAKILEQIEKDPSSVDPNKFLRMNSVNEKSLLDQLADYIENIF